MKPIPLDERLIRGAVSVERIGSALKPWRIPHEDRELFPPASLNGKAAEASGVRLALNSGTTVIEVEVAPADHELALDCVIDGDLAATCRLAAGQTAAAFTGLPACEKRIQLYVDQRHPVVIRNVRIEDDATYLLPPAAEPRWITYGSSITACAAALSPAMTWPAIVSRRHGLDLTCLGYDGNCMLEPMVARMIRDLPAEYLSLCLGVNVHGTGSLSPRTFRSAIIGFIQIIREKHPTTPIAAISPIFALHREHKANKTGFTLSQIREEVGEVIALLQQRGDHALQYVNGLDLFGAEFDDYLPDHVHPDAGGCLLLADQFSEKIVKRLWRVEGRSL